MRKEVVVAVFLGGLIGVILAFGVWRARGIFDRKSDVTMNTLQTSENEATSEATLAPMNELTIISPSQDLAVVGTSPLIVSGMAKPGEIVIATNQDSTDIGLTSPEGRYEVEIELQNGLNEIIVAGTLENEISEQVKVRVVFSEGETDEGHALAGVVTDIVEGALQVRDDTGTIQQVSLGEDSEYESQIDDIKKLEFEDVAIGDFVVVQIATTESDIADKVIVMSPPVESLHRTVFGEVLTLNNEEFILQNTVQNWSLDATGGGVRVTTFDKDGAVTDIGLAEVKEGDTIIAVGDLVDEEIEVSRIHLVEPQ